jgi:hypothetical protein
MERGKRGSIVRCIVQRGSHDREREIGGECQEGAEEGGRCKKEIQASLSSPHESIFSMPPRKQANKGKNSPAKRSRPSSRANGELN